ncbi:hypothetical protein CHS0354_011731 [Potamilus streckersoni]|uniref:Major facilitator superfamily (MFS) profile domain-containing protein n=1 Tax=Potamilus streckersoni TaxID=2493646 RepID=A0AAE0SJP0_9BIVA|nr:hypothetical protein CHS0354_011731 [Potamilus streckersoni]
MHVFWQCVFTFFQGFIVNGVINVIIPALEKRYSLPSSRSGLIASSNDFGAFACYLFIGYFGERRNKPRIMAVGMLLMAVGSFVFSLPQFISGRYQYTISDPGSSTQTSNLCTAENKNGSHYCDAEKQKDSSIGIYSMFIVGQILLGIGASPSFTLGLTYIDENCKPKLTSFYISVAVGYIVGGQTLSLFADIDKVSSSSVLLTPKDPQWVGAWWIGTLIGAAMFLFVAFPFIGYPKRLPGYEELRKLRKSEAHAGSDDTIAKQKHFGKSMKDFPKALLILVQYKLLPCKCD